MSGTIHERLGGGPPAGVEQVTLFVPSVNRFGQPIDQGYWTEQALVTFGQLFRGATAFPPGRGVWRDDEHEGELVFDDAQMVLSYVAEGLFDDADVVKSLKSFLCRMGRETDQGEIGIVVDGTYIGIVDFDDGGGA